VPRRLIGGVSGAAAAASSQICHKASCREQVIGALGDYFFDQIEFNGSDDERGV